jgi:hypothetical protein
MEVAAVPVLTWLLADQSLPGLAEAVEVAEETEVEEEAVQGRTRQEAVEEPGEHRSQTLMVVEEAPVDQGGTMGR